MSSSPTNGSSRSTRSQHLRNIRPLSSIVADEYVNNEVINSRYTAVTFLPKNLYEQFRRPLNLYFLLVSCLQFISIIAPVNPLSTLLPLLFAFSLTAAKEGYDDVKRHRQDDEYNSRRFKVLRDGAWVSVKSKDIHVGDIVEVKRNDEIPCDMVGIAAPDPVIFIRTDNLDGEIDLKPRDRLPLVSIERAAISGSIQNITPQSSSNSSHAAAPPPPPQQLAEAASNILLSCPPPSATINSFDARLEITDQNASDGRRVVSLSHNHLLLQSAYLKNTTYVYGVAIYTGNETKCGMNKAQPPVKWAKLDQQVSNYGKIIFAFQMLIGLTFGIIGYTQADVNRNGRWYATAGVPETTASYLIFPLRFFLLTSVMIPISFKFVVDMSKYFMALVLEWDLEMWDEERGVGMKVKNSGIVEDLARVEYVLSDKTGTITQNVMTLVSASIDGTRFHNLQEPALVSPPDTESGRTAWKEFMTCLAICNTCEVEGGENGTALTYAAPSPDEEALCAGAAKLGVVLTNRTKNNLTVSAGGTERTFSIHEVFAFTSDRKCMSIIVQEHVDGHMADHVYLITKGADDKVLGLLRDPLGNSDIGKVALSHLKDFAGVGLRTLVFGSKKLSKAEFEAFREKYDAAKAQVEGRQAAEEQLQKEIEKGLTFVGVSAIEDKLQENVEKALCDLIDANIRVWMLTGDKVETARQIALSCGLMSKHDQCLVIHGEGWEQKLDGAPIPVPPRRRPVPLQRSFSTTASEADDRARDGLLTYADTSNHATVSGLGFGEVDSPRPRNSNYGSSMRDLANPDADTVLVVHGDAIDAILKDKHYQDKFRDVATKCKSVVCARVTPSQKAKITAFVSAMGKTTLAIGDGGNDVAMIQEAHVGVGIMGKEGQQAARSADFAISQFQYLPILLFVHGHLSYKRTCYVVQYSFYKSMLISFVQLVFNSYATWVSGVSFWNSFALTMWNGCYTLPQTLFYCLDRCAPREALQRNPSLYRLPQKGYGQTPYTFFGFILRGMIQAAGLMLLISYFLGPTYAAADGSTESTDVQFTAGYSALILLQLFTVLIESHTITIINAIGLLGMPLVYFVFTVAYSSVPRFDYYGVFDRTMNMPMALVVFLMCAILFLPHLLFHCARLNFSPNMVELFRAVEVLEQQRMSSNILRHRLANKMLTGTERAILHAKIWLAGWVDIDVRKHGQRSTAYQANPAVDP